MRSACKYRPYLLISRYSLDKLTIKYSIIYSDSIGVRKLDVVLPQEVGGKRNNEGWGVILQNKY